VILNPPFSISFMMDGRPVFSSSKLRMIFSPFRSNTDIPSIPFRIEPILPRPLQVAQPGTVITAVFMAGKAAGGKSQERMSTAAAAYFSKLLYSMVLLRGW
jgi:hypothetical protein